MDSDAGGDGFKEGEKVEARFGGKSRFFKGEIIRVRNDGTFMYFFAEWSCTKRKVSQQPRA